MGNNETTPLRPDSLLGKFMKASESKISKTIENTANANFELLYSWFILFTKLNYIINKYGLLTVYQF